MRLGRTSFNQNRFYFSEPPTNGFQMTQTNSAVAPANIPIASQGKEKTSLTSAFNFTQAPPQIINGSPIGEISKTFTLNLGAKPTPTQQQSPLKSILSIFLINCQFDVFRCSQSGTTINTQSGYQESFPDGR